MNVLKITYSGASASLTLYIENSSIVCGVTSISLATYDTITKVKTELEKITGITATILNNSGTYSSSKLNEISILYPAELVGNTTYLSYDNYSSPKDVCELFNLAYSTVKTPWFDIADNSINARTGFKFKEISVTETIDVSNDQLKMNEKYIDKYDLFNPGFNELELCHYAPIQSISSLSIDGTSITYTTLITTYNSIILTGSSEKSEFVVGQDKATYTLNYGYSKTSSYGTTAKLLASYLVYDIYQNNNSGITVAHGGTVVNSNEQIDMEKGVIVRRNSQMIKNLFASLPSKIYIGGI